MWFWTDSLYIAPIVYIINGDLWASYSNRNRTVKKCWRAWGSRLRPGDGYWLAGFENPGKQVALHGFYLMRWPYFLVDYLRVASRAPNAPRLWSFDGKVNDEVVGQ
jgi:hypothetical protein